MRVPLFAKTRPVFILLLPVFFVFHGFVEHYDFISLKDAFLLWSLYLGSMLILLAISWLFFRHFIKAAVISFCLMAFFFFFGSLQDLLRKHFTGSFFSRYSFILPL